MGRSEIMRAPISKIIRSEKRISRDLTLIAFICILTFIAARFLGFYTYLCDRSDDLETFGLDGLIIVLGVLVVSLCVFSIRRIHEMVEEKHNRLEAESTAREEKIRYTSLFETITEGIMITSPDGMIIEANPAAFRMLGLMQTGPVSYNFTPGWNFLRPDGTPLPRNEMAAEQMVRYGSSVRDIVMGIQSPDGHVTWVNTNAGPIVNEHGNKIATITTLIEITEILKAQEERSRAEITNTTINAMGDGLVVIGLEGRIINVNQTFERMSGYRSQDLVDRHGSALISKLITIKDDQNVIHGLRDAIAGEVKPFGTISLLTRDSREIPIAITASYMRDKDGKPAAIIATFKDVTQIMKMEEAMRENEEKFRSIATSANDAIIMIDDNGVIIYWNPAATQIFGYTSPEAEGRKLTRLILPSRFREELTSRMKRTRVIGKKIDYVGKTVEITAQRKTGEEFPIEFSFSYLIIKGSYHTIGIIRDITERKAAEATLHFQANLLNNVRESVIATDLNGYIVYWSQASERLYGITAEEVIGKALSYVVGAEVYEEEKKRMAYVYENGSWSGQYIQQRKDGTTFWLENTISLVNNEIGQPNGYIGIARDVTAKVKAENLLRHSEELQRAFFEGSVDPIIMTDLEDKIFAVNPAMERLFGYTADELINQTFPGHFGIDEGKLDEWIEACRSGNGISGYQTIRRAKSGELIPVSLTVSPIRDSNGELVSLSFWYRDITREKQSEEALQTSEKQYRNLVEKSLQGLVIIRGEPYRLVFANSAIADILGYTVDEMLSIPPEEIRKIVHPEDRDRFFQMIRDLITGKPISLHNEIRTSRKNGSICWGVVYGSRIDYQGEPAVQIAFMDITDRKRYENQIQASLKEKEVMLQEIHHRVKNNLQIISSLLYLQSEHLRDQDVLDILKESQNRVKSMALVHERLYQSKDLARIDIRDYIRNLAAYLFRSFGVNPAIISLSVHVEDIYLSIDQAIPCGLIINELASNSLKHGFPDGRTGEIRVELIHGQGNSLILTVSDNGVSLPEDVDYRNTETMGLHLVNTLIRQLDGTIDLDRSQGTSFTITFNS